MITTKTLTRIRDMNFDLINFEILTFLHIYLNTSHSRALRYTKKLSLILRWIIRRIFE